MTIDGLQMLLAQAVGPVRDLDGHRGAGGRDAKPPSPLGQEGGMSEPLLATGALRGHRPGGPGADSGAPRVAIVGVRRPRLGARGDDGPGGRGPPDRRRPRLRRGVEPAAPVALRRGGRGAGPAQGGGGRGAACARSTPTSTCAAVVADFSADNAAALLAGADLVLDGTDNFETRFLLNDVCVRAGIPWVYGACVGLLRPGPPGPAAGLALPALRARGAAPAGLRPHLRHGRRRRARSCT